MIDNDNQPNQETTQTTENKKTDVDTEKADIADVTCETAENKKDMAAEDEKEREKENNENNEKDEKDGKHLKKEVKKLHDELKQKKEDYDVLYDKYLRVSAEYENFRKRTTKEKEGIYTDAAIDVLKNILPVIDNVERALQFADNSNNANTDNSGSSDNSDKTDSGKIFEGVKMIYSQFMASLAKIGVEEIKAVDETFNPELHNAVIHAQDENRPDNTVAEVLQKGYIKGDKVIRPAMVKVVN
ncbi:MAG: nucleotide exchange factor GrpE [Oscillospiraceae bacterium]|nr:nucleotide exchange factor GrpE [Oscillospiraceae bacterium]